MTHFHGKKAYFQPGSLEHFKASMNDWVIFLGKELKDAKVQINDLQKRIEKLEMDPGIRL